MKQFVMTIALAIAWMLVLPKAEAFVFETTVDEMLDVVDVPSTYTGEVWAVARTESYTETRNTIWGHCQNVIRTYDLGLASPEAVNECEREVASVNGTTTDQLGKLEEGAIVVLPLPRQLEELYLTPKDPPVDVVAELGTIIAAGNAEIITAINAQAIPPDLTADFEALQDAVERLEANDQRAEQHDEELATLRNELATLRQERVDELEKTAELAARVFALEGLLTDERVLRAELVAALQSTIDGYREENEALRNENATLEAVLQQLQEHEAAGDERTSILEEENARLQTVLSETQRENAELNDQITAMQDRITLFEVATTEQSVAAGPSSTIRNPEQSFEQFLSDWYREIIITLGILSLVLLLTIVLLVPRMVRAERKRAEVQVELRTERGERSRLQEELGNFQGQHAELQVLLLRRDEEIRLLQQHEADLQSRVTNLKRVANISGRELKFAEKRLKLAEDHPEQFHDWGVQTIDVDGTLYPYRMTVITAHGRYGVTEFLPKGVTAPLNLDPKNLRDHIKRHTGKPKQRDINEPDHNLRAA